MKYTVCVLFLTFVLFGSAYGFGSYCPLNPDGQCSGIQGTSSNEASGDSFFYCDVGATFVGSKSCQYLSYIDGRFPVTTAVRPDGYPIIFFASTPQHPDATFIPTFFINCYDYGCTDVSEPGLLPDINGLFGVDTAIVSEGGVEVLAVAGVGEQLSLSDLGFQYNFQDNRYGGPFGLVQSTFAQYHVVLAQSSGPECQNFTSNLPNLPPVYNAHISPVLVEIQDLPGATFPLGLSYYTVKLLIQDFYDLETNSYNWIQSLSGIHVRSDDEAEVSDKEVDEKTTTGAYNAYQAFTSTRNPDFISHYLVIVSCFDPLCQFEDEIVVPIHSSSQMTAFPGDLPWFSNDNTNNQETAFLDAEFYENAQRTLPNAPFGYNTFIPRPIFLRNKEGQIFVGLQALQRVPLSEIRGVDPCRVIQHIQGPEEIFTQEQSGHFARALDQQTKTAFGGTTNVRFFQCPNEEASNEEPFACESTEEASNFFTQSIPDPRSSVQFNGRSNARILSLRDANVFSISDPSVRTEVNDQFNIADSSPNNDFETFESVTPTLCSTGNPNNVLNRDVDERDIGGNMPTFVAGSAQSGLTAPASLVVGIAGNGLPAVLGISTSVTGEPSAAGWALILTVCLDSACDQQVQRYLMDSTTLHDSWGIMDDPFAAVNQILNHPDGSWAVVLFVQPQGEQIDRNGVPTNRGEGSSGKPFIINCLDETCSTAYVSNHAPNRIQSSIPYEYYDGQGNPVVINYVHSFQYVGDAAEYLLVTVRDAPFILPQDDPEIPYLPPPVRFWKTNRYASPTGFPCTPEAVGTMETVDSSLYICTRLNTGHDLNLGGVNGWVRYYEWVDVGHSFGARLWANIPAGRSPLALSLPEQNVPIVQLPIIVSFTGGPAPPAPVVGRGYINDGNYYAALEGSIQTCCSTTQLLLQNGDGYDIYFDLPVHPQELEVYFASLAGYSNPLLGFFVYPIHPDGIVGQAPVFAGYDHSQYSGSLPSEYLYCTYLSIPLNTFQGKVSGFRIIFDGTTNCQTSPVCDIFIGGFKLYGSTNSGQTTSSGFPQFYPYPPELNPEYNDAVYPYYCNPTSSF